MQVLLNINLLRKKMKTVIYSCLKASSSTDNVNTYHKQLSKNWRGRCIFFFRNHHIIRVIPQNIKISENISIVLF